MRPAFSSTRQAAAFALLLLVVMLSPVLVGKRLLPPRSEVYSSIWWGNGDFPYIDQQIFREKGDIDILFIGASHIWAGFDTPKFQRELGKLVGRPAVARTFGWGGAGYDQMYFLTQDLLEHRKVRMLVFDDVFAESDRPHLLAPHWFRFGDNAQTLEGLPQRTKAAYYFAAVLGMPRALLSLVRPSLPAELDSKKKTFWEVRAKELNPVAQLGAGTARIGFRPDPKSDAAPFVEYAPQTGIRATSVCVYSPATKTNFAFSPNSLPQMQQHFVKKFAALADEHDCKLVVVHIPTFEERASKAICEPVFWPDIVPGAIMVGIPPATLFKGLADDDIQKLYTDSVHFNQNGQDYFTTLMTPILLQIYGSQPKP